MVSLLFFYERFSQHYAFCHVEYEYICILLIGLIYRLKFQLHFSLHVFYESVKLLVHLHRHIVHSSLHVFYELFILHYSFCYAEYEYICILLLLKYCLIFFILIFWDEFDLYTYPYLPLLIYLFYKLLYI